MMSLSFPQSVGFLRFGADTRGPVAYADLHQAAIEYASAQSALTAAQDRFDTAKSRFDEALAPKDFKQHDARVKAGEVLARLRERLGTEGVAGLIQAAIDLGCQ